MMRPLEVIASFERHIQSEVNIGLSTLEHACATAMPTVVCRLRSITPSMQDAIDAIERLHAYRGLFTLEQRRDMGHVVKAYIKNDFAQTSTRMSAVMQSHRLLYNYFPLLDVGYVVLFSYKNEEVQTLGSVFDQDSRPAQPRC